MELKVKELGVVEQKSVQEVEKELLEKHEASLETTEPITEPITKPSSELKEEDVLSFIKDRYNKEITSVDQLFAEREQQEELPEDVKAYYEYRKKTGRGIEDYIKLNRDFDSMSEDQLLREYFLSTGEAIDSEDAEMMIEDYQWDEDLDEEKDIKKKKLALKKVVAKAKEFFTEQKEMYKQPLESSTVGISQSEKEEFEAYKQYIAQAKTQDEELQRRRDWYEQKTNEVFQDFKGFDFKIGDTTFTFAPSSAAELKQNQLNTGNFINKFLDESGLLKDARGYHRALAVAMNPDRFAKFFYEQGMADATEDVTRKMKNVEMSERKAPEVTRKDGVQIRAVNPSSGKGLRIRSKNV